jgi:DinB superfamily
MARGAHPESLPTILENLSRSQTALLSAADTVPAVQWTTSPGKDQWSAAELIAHLITIEKAIVQRADRILQHPPLRVPLFQRWHLPMALLESRLIKRKSPLPLDTELLRDKEEMLAGLRGARERTLAFIEETQGRDLSVYAYRHPFIGTLNLYEWFQMIASHEIRHTKQMKEIAGRLPKVG